MTASVHVPKGRTYLRGVIARQSGASIESITARWGNYAAADIEKAAVSVMVHSEVGDAAVEFMGVVREQSVLGKLAGSRQVPFNRRLLIAADGSQGYWVGEAKPAPLSRMTLEGSELDGLKVNAVMVASKEAFREPILEPALQRDLERAASQTIDQAMLDRTNAGIANERPAAVTFGAPTIASALDPAADIAALIAAFEGDLDTAYFVTDPTTAAQIALARDAGGAFQFPDASPRGGSIIGIPLITSRSSPRDVDGGQIALIDAGGIAYGFEGILVEPSEHASLEMSDTPTDPSTAATVMVSLWQQNLVALKISVYANWEAQRAGGVVVLTGAEY